MKNTLLFYMSIIWLLGIVTLHAQISPYTLNWSHTISTVSDEQVFDVRNDNMGNTYISGMYKGTLTLGSTTLTNSGDWDIFIAKMNSQQQYLWAKKIGSSGLDECPYIRISSSGECFVGFLFHNTVSLGSINITSDGYRDVGFTKISSTGEFVWAVKGGGQFDEHLAGIDISPDGFIYATGSYGYFNGFSGVSATFGAYSLTTPGDHRSNIYVAKLSAEGIWSWAVQSGGYEWDSGGAIYVGYDGLVYITGIFSYSMVFGSTTLSSPAHGTYIACCDENANWLWAISQTGGEGGTNIIADSDHNVYLTARDEPFGGAVGFGPIGSFNLCGGWDAYIAKLDSNHNWLWYKSISSSGEDLGAGGNRGLVIDNINNEIITTLSLGGPLTLEGQTYNSNGDIVNLIIGMDMQGNVTWVNQSGSIFGYTSEDFSMSISLDNNILNIYGWYKGSTYDTGFNTVINNGQKDGFILSLSRMNRLEGYPSSGQVPLSVGFRVTPTPEQSETVSWDFENDGVIDSNELSPTHNYTEPGVYSVKLLIQNGTDIDTILEEDMITVTMPSNPRIVATPDTLRYGNVATNSTVSKPMNIYNWGGEDLEIYSISAANARYTVTLPAGLSYPIIIPSLSSIEITVNFTPLAVQAYNTNLVIVSNDPDNGVLTKRLEGSGYILSANFSATPLSGDIPLLVQFNDTSQGDIVAHLWDFGDGNTSTELNPTHTYVEKGLYDVTLTVQDQYISRSITRPDYISAIAHPVIATPDSSGIEFGIVYLGDTGTHQLLLQSAGTDTVFVTSVGFYQPGSAYSVTPESIPEYILPGMQAVLDVSFHPYQASSYNDTLYVYNSSENKPILKIKLRGIGEYVPPQTPQGVTIVIDGYDAVISWEAVTQNIYNTPITVPYYFIYGSLIPNPGPTEQIFIGYSTGTTFHHAGVNLPGSNVQPPPQYFYTVTAVVWYPPRYNNISLNDLIGRTKDEVERQLR